MLKPSVLPLVLCCWLCAGRGRSVKDYPPHGKDGGMSVVTRWPQPLIPGLLDTTARPGPKQPATHKPGKVVTTHPPTTATHTVTKKARPTTSSAPVTKTSSTETVIHGDFIDVNPEAGFHGDACLAKIECKLHKVPPGFVIVSVSLYHVSSNDVKGNRTLLARADRHTAMTFTDHHGLSHGGVAAINSPVCVGQSDCGDTATYLISPIQEEDLGEYRCEVVQTFYHQVYRWVGSGSLKFDRCCKPCSSCDDTVGGVWDAFSNWSPWQCTSCSQRRQPVGCATTSSCKGKPPTQTRRCFEDGLCDETFAVKILTEKVGDLCRARIQCKVVKMCDVQSVKLYHLVQRNTPNVTNGFEMKQYNSSALLAQATVGVQGGRFHEVADHPNGGVSPDIPSDPQLCRGTDNCRQYYTYTFDTVNPGNEGDYACVVTGSNGWGNGGRFIPAKLTFSEDCPKPSTEDVHIEACEEKCLKKYLVPSLSEAYVRFYCLRVCELDPHH